MKDLLKEEKLEQRILQMANACGKKKWTRVKRTFFVLCSIIYLIALIYGAISNIKDCLYWLIIAPVTSGFIMFISWGVLSYIITGAMEDEKAIAKLLGELNAIKFSD